MSYRFKVILQREKEGGYSVFVPALPGCASQGETAKEAMTNIKEAIDLYMETLKEDHLPVPKEDFVMKEVVVTA